MEKIIKAFIMALVVFISSPPTVKAANFLWICPQASFQGSDIVFEIETDNGELARHFLDDLNNSGKGKLLRDPYLYENKDRPATYLKITFIGSEMTIKSEDPKNLKIEPKSNFVSGTYNAPAHSQSK